jgi:hypothetical protein
MFNLALSTVILVETIGWFFKFVLSLSWFNVKFSDDMFDGVFDTGWNIHASILDICDGL